MKTVLAIFSSLNGTEGNSSKLANEYLLKIENDDSVRINRVDVASLALPHLTGEEMQAWMTDASERNESQHALAKISDNIVEAVKAADEIVLAVPMYNFGIPSSLKAYFDRIARAGITFKYTETGPVGLLENKSATVFAARGGVYAGSSGRSAARGRCDQPKISGGNVLGRPSRCDRTSHCTEPRRL